MKSRLCLLTPFLTILFALLKVFYANPGEIWTSDFVILFTLLFVVCIGVLACYYLISRSLEVSSLGAAITFMPFIFLSEASSVTSIWVTWLLAIGAGVLVLFLRAVRRIQVSLHLWIIVCFGSLSVYYATQIGISKVRIYRQIANLNDSLEEQFTQLKCSQKKMGAFEGDIYFIILDELISSLAFKNYYQYDNNAFFSGLTQLGFNVVQNSYSNYPWTIPSVSSMVTMDFHQNWVQKKEFPQVAHHLIRYNFVSKLLESEGYNTLSLPSIYWLGNGNKGALKDFIFRSKSYGLTLSLLRSTPLASIARKMQRKYHREHILSQLDSIEQFAFSKHGKTLLFAHFLCPHRPIVFDKYGGDIPESKLSSVEKDKNHHHALDQAYFVSNAIRKLVDNILKNASTPPIIVLMSDHGKFPIGKNGKGKRTLPIRDLSWRFSNLIAIYHPDESYVPKKLSTSVNVFRGLLSHTFGYYLPLKEDEICPDFFDYSKRHIAKELISFQEN